MNVIDACVFIQTSVERLQRFDPALRNLGDPYPALELGIAEALLSVCLSRSSQGDNRHGSGKSVLTSLFRAAIGSLENHVARKLGQRPLTLFEGVVDAATAKYGEDRIASLFIDEETKHHGREIARLLSAAGLLIKDHKRLERLFVQASGLEGRRAAEPHFSDG